ncbi:MAG: hypothetical protein WCY09_10205 [Candidatus Omnitrophota bacterium]|jgi:hypothetical protein
MSQENDQALEAFLQWAAGLKKVEDDRKSIKYKYIREKFVPHEIDPNVVVEPYDINRCNYCRKNKTCKLDFDGIFYTNHKDRNNNKDFGVKTCPNFSDNGEPLPDEKCWVCGEVGCDFKVLGDRIDYGTRFAIDKNCNIVHTDKEVRTHIWPSVHDKCYDIGYWGDSYD